MSNQGTVTKGSLLIAGTTIGGGMLAMPLLTSMGGFIPSLALFFVCWAFMACTGLLFLEVCLWMKGDTNMVSMAESTLGKFGKYSAWVMYLFLFYTLTLAYTVGCGKITAHAFGGVIPDWAATVLVIAVLTPLVWAGAHLIGRINLWLMAGLALSFFGFVGIAWRFVDWELLAESNWLFSLKTLPVAFTAFGFQGSVPTLVRYMDFDKRKTMLSILIGSFIPLVTYILWHYLILGIVPREGPGGLLEALEKGMTAVQPLAAQVDDPRIGFVSQFFAFFALVTSFLGVSLGLRDFLADGMQITKNRRGRLYICLLIFVPVLIAAISYPDIFIESLGYAGGYGCAFLLGLLPILMVWNGRYRLGLPNETILPGGRALLIIMALFVTLELTIETLHVLRLF